MTSRNTGTFMSCCAAHAILLLFMLSAAHQANAASAMLNVEIPAGTFKSIRLQTLPKGTVVDVRIESTGSIFLAMVNTKGYVSSSRPLFVGQIDKTVSFSVTIPKLDDYYLVIDNRKGADARSVSIAFQATKPSKNNPPKKSVPFTS